MSGVEVAQLAPARSEDERAANRGAATVLDWRLGGVLLGLLVTLAVALQGPLGVSGSYVKADAIAAAQVDEALVRGNDYLSSFGTAISPELLVVFGMVGGGLLGSLLVRRRTAADALPRAWRERFGARRALRFGVAFVSGGLLLFGARLAGGCTSGHVISGMSQLAISGMVFAAAVFASGIPTALLMYRRSR